MSDRLVTIAAFGNPYEANIARGALEAAGIPACLSNEEVASMAWMLTNAVGGVKLQVRERDAERAIEVIAERHSYDDGPETFPENDSDEKINDDPPSSPERDSNPREENADRAFRSAVLGLALIPLQLYTTWLLIRAWTSAAPIRPTVKRRLWIATAINTFAMLVAMSILWFIVEASFNRPYDGPIPGEAIRMEIEVPLIIAP